MFFECESKDSVMDKTQWQKVFFKKKPNPWLPKKIKEKSNINALFMNWLNKVCYFLY